MIQHDWATRGLVVTAVLLTIMLFLYTNLEAVFTPILLLFGAGIIRLFVHTKKIKVDPNISPTEAFDTIYYSLIALLALYTGSIIVDGLYYPPVPSAIASLALTMPIILTTFVILMAISETLFFQGELLSLFSTKNRKVGILATAILINASVFMFFHLNAYGTSIRDLSYVGLGGVTLAWSAIKTQRLLTPAIAHIINNITGTEFIIPAFILMGFFLVMMTYRKRRRARFWGMI